MILLHMLANGILRIRCDYRRLDCGVDNFDWGQGNRRISMTVNSFVVFKTELLRNADPFQSRLPSHRVLALLLLAFPVLERLEFLKALLASLVFLVGALSIFLLHCAVGIVPLHLRHGRA